MVEVTIDGSKTVRSLREIYIEFVDTKLYDFIKAGLSGDPREEIRVWVKENYEVDEDTFKKIFTHITVTI